MPGDVKMCLCKKALLSFLMEVSPPFHATGMASILFHLYRPLAPGLVKTLTPGVVNG